MARVTQLKVPQGYLNLYTQVFNFSNSTQAIASKPGRAPYPPAYRAELRARAPALLLKDSWNSLTEEQKSAWHFYWGGWPGSGYSSFLQINTVRFINEEDLYLDPPENFGDEILVNHNFEKLTHLWSQDVGGFGVVQKQAVLPYPTKISQVFNHIAGSTYRLKIRAQVFKLSRTRGVNSGSYRVGILEDDYLHDVTQKRDKYLYINLDITPAHASGPLTFYIENIEPKFTLILDKVSLKKVL